MMGIIVLRFFCHSSMFITSVRAAWSAAAVDLALVDGALSRYSWALHAFFVTGGDVFL